MLLFLSERKWKLYFGGLYVFLLLSLAGVDCPWDEDEYDEVSPSLSSRSLGDLSSDLRLGRHLLCDLPASGTGFWVMKRLSPESLHTHNYTFRD